MLYIERSKRLINEFDDEDHEFIDAVTEEFFTDNSDEWDLVGMDPAEIAEDGNNGNGDLDEDNEDGGEDNNNVIQPNQLVKLAIGSRKITNIRVATVNQNAFKNVIEEGREKMKDANLFITRKRRQARQNRILETRKAIYETICNQDDERHLEIIEYIDKSLISFNYDYYDFTVGTPSQ